MFGRFSVRALGINFITIPAPLVTHQSYLAFQQAIHANGLDYVRAENPENRILVKRDTPSPLHITVNLLDQQVGQFLVVAPNPKTSLNLFIQELEASLKAFKSVWPSDNRQIIKSDATIRALYETTSEHAFQELWEKRLNQPTQALALFERPIRGGGLRFVLEPSPNEDEPVQIEVKIESYLKDTTKIFVETQFIWIKPTAPGTPINPEKRLLLLNDYIENQVHKFLKGENK